MPDGQKEYSTLLKIGGAIDANLTTGLKTLGKSILGITQESKKMGKEAKSGFFEMKEGAEGAKRSVETLKDSLGELLGPILAVTAGFASIKGVFGVLDTAADKYKEIRAEAAQLRSVVAGTYLLRKNPGALDAQMKLLEEQQDKAKKTDMGVFGNRIFEAEQTELVTRAGLGTKLTDNLVAAIPTAVAKMQGGLDKVTVDSVKETTDAVALAVKTGRARGPLFGFEPRQMKEFRAATEAGRILMIAQTANFSGGTAYLAEQKRDLPEQFKLIQLKRENAEHEIALGKEWLDIHEQVEGISLEVQETLFDVLKDVIIPLEPYIKSALDALDDTVKKVGSFANWLLKDPNEVQLKLTKCLNDAFDASKAYMKSIGLGWLVDDATAAHKALGNNLGNDVAAGGGILAGMGLGRIILENLFGKNGKEGALSKVAEMTVNAGIVYVNGKGIGEGIPGGGKGGTVVAEATKEVAGGLLTWLPALSIAAMGIGAVELHKRFGILGMTSVEPGLSGTGTSGGAARADTNPLFQSSAQVARAAREHRDSLLDLTKTTVELKGLQEHLNVNTIPKFDAALTTATGNDLFHFNLALDEATNKLLNLATLAIGGGSGGGGGGGGGGSDQAQTQYGPKIDYVDAQGHVHGTPDSDSTKGIGHIDGVQYDLKTGVNPVAMHDAFARSHGFTPGSSGPDPYNPNRTVTWKDTTGARNPANVDSFTGMSAGGFVRSATLALLHKGETVIPGDKGIAKGLGSGHTFAPTINLGGLTIHGGSEDLVGTINQVLEQNFERAMTTAFEHYQRVNLS